MKDVSEKNIGLIIAFLLPGFWLLWGLSFSFGQVALLLANSREKDAPSIGGFLYATLASLSLGLLLSAVRWLLVDHLLQLMGIRDQGLNFENLKDKDRYAAFIGAIENHYRYYQYYANTLVAIVGAFVIYLFVGKDKATVGVWLIVGVVCVTLLLGASDALKKYFERAHAILK
jgi:hypothetical protein